MGGPPKNGPCWPRQTGYDFADFASDVATVCRFLAGCGSVYVDVDVLRESLKDSTHLMRREESSIVDEGNSNISNIFLYYLCDRLMPILTGRLDENSGVSRGLLSLR